MDKEKVKELVTDFSSKNWKDKNEEWVKWNYIEPLMELLGWDRQDIVKEKRVLKGRADYILKIGNEEVLVIEAKRPGVSLGEDEGRQAVSYAYHRKIKFALLTNFKEIRVYHALSNIKDIDRNLLKFEGGGYFRLNFDQFEDNFDKLMLLSKESFENKEINKLLSKKDERTAKPVDESILADLLQIREWLSKDLKKLRMDLSKERIDEAVQVFIDRLIFMRSVEDRGLEGKNFLLGFVKDFNEGRLRKRLWDILQDEFIRFDKEYNSKLFASGILEDEEVFFGDGTIKKSIRALYFGTKDSQARYSFDEIPGDLLGSIYEQYLGTILQETEKRVKLETKTGKRKKMGIYYTPFYIVDYIVKNTVGEYLKEKTIDEILEVRILDPACGSGSFLTRAFDEVCIAVEERLKKEEKPRKWNTFDHYKDRLTLNQKATILENCIYGIDLDEKAVELSRLNLLLKLLEDETSETKKRILPNMSQNIQEGNSLIDDYKVSNKAFKWNSREKFGEIMRNGGFDIVVGNPPYVRVDNLDKKDKEYWKQKFDSSKGKYDLYYLFVEKVFNLLKNEGNLGFIIPNKFCAASSAKELRKILINNSEIIKIISVSKLPIFKEASNYPIVLLSKKGEKAKSLDVGFALKEKEIIDENFTNYSLGQKDIESLPDKLLPINTTQPQINLVIKLLRNNNLLEGSLIIQEGLRIPSQYENEGQGDFEILKQYQFGRYSSILKGTFISKKDLRKVTSENSTRYKNSLVDKIVIAEDALFITSTIDIKKMIPQGGIYFASLLSDSVDLEYFLALLNSKLFSFVYKVLFGGMHMGGGYLRYRTEFLGKLPLKVGTKKSSGQNYCSC